MLLAASQSLVLGSSTISVFKEDDRHTGLFRYSICGSLVFDFFGLGFLVADLWWIFCYSIGQCVGLVCDVGGSNVLVGVREACGTWLDWFSYGEGIERVTKMITGRKLCLRPRRCFAPLSTDLRDGSVVQNSHQCNLFNQNKELLDQTENLHEVFYNSPRNAANPPFHIPDFIPAFLQPIHGQCPRTHYRQAHNHLSRPHNTLIPQLPPTIPHQMSHPIKTMKSKRQRDPKLQQQFHRGRQLRERGG